MFIKKFIEIGVNINDPISLAVSDDNLLNILIDRFENICMRSCYIIKVLRIVRQGDCIPNMDGQPNFSTIPVIFEVDAYILEDNEIINGCVVQQKIKKSEFLNCKTPIGRIIVPSKKILESVVEGQIISVRVGRAKFDNNAKHVVVNAFPFIQYTTIILFEIDKIIDSKIFTLVLEQIKEEEEKINIIKKKPQNTWAPFAKLLYAYVNPQPKPKPAIELNIFDLAKGNFKDCKYVSRDPQLDLSLPLCYGYKELPTLESVSKHTNYIVSRETNTDNSIIQILKDYLGFIRTIREMIEIYSTEELMVSHKNLWQIFKKNKVSITN
jgi:DNA-directed RNA polymerase subunit E'/Rpb7